MRFFCLALVFVALLTAIAVSAQQSSPAPEQAISAYHLDPPLLQKAEALYRIRITRYVAYLVYTPFLLYLFLRLRLAARFRTLAESISRYRFAQAFIVTALLLLLLVLLTLPLDAHGHSIAVRYGLSVQPWTSWLWDICKGFLVNVAVATLLVWGFYALVRRYPQRWWLASSLCAGPLALVALFLAPLVIDPIFNHYDPLAEKQPALARAIEKVVQRGGLSIPESRMFEMRASDKVTTYNAYVTGIGASKRIVVWDTTARDLSQNETLFVFGHEMGHYVLHHIWIGGAFAIAGLFVSLWLIFHVYRFLLPRVSVYAGIREPSDLSSLPLLLLIAFVLSFLSSPLQSAISRHLEHQADVYGIEVIHGIVPDANLAGAAAFQKMGERGLSLPDPNPLLVFWTYDHPTIAERVRFCIHYRPWDNAQPGRFFK